MSTKHQHIIYSAEDIKRYLAGDMSNDEMHAIEKAALDDPLLADAIEGYSGAEEQDWSSMLAALKNKVEVKAAVPVIDIKKSSNFKWWKAAAAVLLVGITGTLAYLLNTKNESQSVAKTENIQALDSSIVPLIKADTIDEKTVAINEPPKREKDNISTLAKPVTADGNSAIEKRKGDVNDDFVYKPEYDSTDTNRNRAAGFEANKAPAAELEEKAMAVQNPAAPSTSNSPENLNSTDVQTKQIENQPAANGYLKKEAINYFNKNYQIRGSVMSSNGEPLAFANLKLTVPNKQFITADANGMFVIPAQDSIITVEIVSFGFEPGKFKLNANTNNAVKLYSSNKSLSEVVISSNISKDKLAKKRVNTVDDELDETAEPSGGWDSYNEYLSSNLHVPSNNQNNIGTVEAVVKVNRKGEVDDVKITQSLNAECDKEAVRLIKKGPGWKLKSGKKGYGKVKIQFNQ